MEEKDGRAGRCVCVWVAGPVSACDFALFSSGLAFGFPLIWGGGNRIGIVLCVPSVMKRQGPWIKNNQRLRQTNDNL